MHRDGMRRLTDPGLAPFMAGTDVEQQNVTARRGGMGIGDRHLACTGQRGCGERRKQDTGNDRASGYSLHVLVDNVLVHCGGDTKGLNLQMPIKCPRTVSDQQALERDEPKCGRFCARIAL